MKQYEEELKRKKQEVPLGVRTMKTLYLVYRWFDQGIFERCTDDGWKLIGMVKNPDLIEQIEEIDRKQFGEDANLQYEVEEIYTDL